MTEITIRTTGTAGRITLSRPKALNALTPDMSAAIEAALTTWRDDPEVKLVVIDAVGDAAFCAGGDIAAIYARGTAGDPGFAQGFWRQEYRMNALIAHYPKPVISLMQGFTMGGGVGVGCHARHRIVGDSSKIAMPECAIGLIPDVGGTWLLGQGPGRVGAYLGLTGERMGAADAIYVGFADHYVPEEKWPDLISALETEGNVDAISRMATAPGESGLRAARAEIDHCFSASTLAEICATLDAHDSDFARAARKKIDRNAPLAMACALALQNMVPSFADVRDALIMEYRATHRGMEQGDFLEGIRALIIDKDRNPRWTHAGPEAVTAEDIDTMLAPLGAAELTLEELA